ncbi:flavodoxin family protein [Clostridium sp. Mt-5]|uniref:Flavodoxin family protein n=1 Tax=Clostridium moutaii TaxID=3240932 RepID=A0ABV4BTT6_9CLOT
MEDKKLSTLVVYYSLEGNTKMMAETISKEIGGDTLRLETKKAISPHGVMKFIRGGGQVIFKKEPELVKYDINPEDYDVLFIGTPTWAGNFAPALRTFFSKTNLKDKKIALFNCNGGQRGKTFENMAKSLEGNEILGGIEFDVPLRNDREGNIKQAKIWSKEIISKIK